MTRARLGTSAVVLLIASAVVLPPVSATSTAPSAAATRAALAAPGQPVRRTGTEVSLPSGDRVVVHTGHGGEQTVLMRPEPAGDTGPATVITANGHTFVIPHSEAARMGRGLDLSRYDVTKLAAAAEGRPLSSLPASRPTPNGLLTAPPKGQLFTVTVNGLDRLGHQAQGDIGVLTNTDDTSRFIAGQSFFRGTFSFSVPRGHYSVQSYIATVDGDEVSFTLATHPQFLVDHDLTVTLDARLGTKFSVTTPRPSKAIHQELNLQRVPKTGESFTDSFVTFDDSPLYATPTLRKVTVGKLYFYPAMRLGDSTGSLSRYLYDVDFPSVGAIPKDLAYDVAAGDLATVSAGYASVVPNRTEEEARLGSMPWQTVQVGSINTLVAPMRRVEYVTARPHLVWRQEVDLDPASGEGRLLSPAAIYQGGDRRNVEWANQPMGSGVEQERVVGQPCPICRTDDTLSVTVFPHVDADDDIMLAGSSSSENLELFQDGTSVGSSRGGFASFPLSADPASYRLQYEVDTAVPWFPTSKHVSTGWEFDSAERAPDHLPPGWTCGGKFVRASTCSFEQILLPHYTTSAGLDGVIPAGTVARVIVDVAPQRGLATDALTSLGAEVSYDAGKTWRTVHAKRQSDTSYLLTYKQPDLADTDGFASLRIAAVADSGSKVSQTTIHAYPLAPLTSRGSTSGGQPVEQPGCAAPVAPPLTQCLVRLATAPEPGHAAPAGYGPEDLQSAYGLRTGPAAMALVAVVTPYDDPNAEADLATYRSEYGLPPCSVESGCLTKVNQNGQASPLPPGSPDWGLQTSLALDAVSAVCPACKILLVEADSSSLTDLVPAALTAARLHADVISNGYGTTGEFSGEQVYEHAYRTLHVPFVVASADYGYGNGVPLVGSISYPSASRYAVAVGGTTLTRTARKRAFTETAWASTTSGCSAYIPKPRWQHDTLCAKRATADVAAVGDPATGLAVYDTYGSSGWQVVGGTGAATAVVAGIFGRHPGPNTVPAAARLYHYADRLTDITSGSNGACHRTYLCTSLPGYDGPTGLGTPHGARPF